jgi:hypothetical protein
MMTTRTGFACPDARKSLGISRLILEIEEAGNRLNRRDHNRAARRPARAEGPPASDPSASRPIPRRLSLAYLGPDAPPPRHTGSR